MGLSNGKITYPFTFDSSSGDVQRCLGYYNESLKSVIENADINMWAKYKPVPYPSDIIYPQMNSDGSWKSDSTWWKGSDNNYGITINVNTYRVGTGSGVCTDDNALPNALNALAANINGGNHGWGYERPWGGANAPYRLLDFNGYNHNAPKPIRNVSVSDVSMTPHRSWTQQVQMLTPSGDSISNRDYLVPTDITSLNLRAGFAIYLKDGSTYKVMAWATGTTWSGFSSYTSDGIIVHAQEGKCEAHFKDKGKYYVLPLFFSRAMSQPSDGMSLNNVGVYIIPAPGVTFYSFRCYSTGTGNIAKPTLSTRQIGALWRFSTTIRFDATDTENYDGGTFDEVQAAVVNETWDGSTYPSSSDAPWVRSGTNINAPSGEVTDWVSTGSVMLVSGHTWKVIVRMKQNGTWTDWNIFQLLQPATT